MSEVQNQTPTKYPLLAVAMGEVVAPVATTAAPHNAEIKTEEPAAQTQSSEPQNANQSPAQTQAPEQTAQASAGSEEVSDEELLAKFNKRAGTNFKSLDELKPKPAKSKEDIEKEEAQFKNDALTWSIENGKITRDAYDKALVDKSKSPREVALAVFTAQLQEEDKTITTDEAEQIFSDTFHEDKADDKDKAKLYATGQKQIEKIAKDYLKSNYGAIDDIETEYKNSLSDRSKFSSYTDFVKDQFNTLAKAGEFEFEFDGENGKKTAKVTVEFDDKDVEAVKKQMLKQEMYYALEANKSELSPKQMQETIAFHLKARTFDKAVAQAAKKASESTFLETMAYLKGIKENPVATTVQTTPQGSRPAPSFPLANEAWKRQGANA